MSRWIETGRDERGNYYLEMIDEESGCRWRVNEVCCQHKSELLGDFPMRDDCDACVWFEPENASDVLMLKNGLKTYE